MRFYDNAHDTVVTLYDLKREYDAVPMEEHIADEEDTFAMYLYDVMDATFRGRNDLTPLDITPRCFMGIGRRLWRHIETGGLGGHPYGVNRLNEILT